ncbi:MAG: FkbM family methyltransferase [Acidimicrobiia bacterium]|nr:FkbM family methyltransferase [Acidimicrobiia bacterium]
MNERSSVQPSSPWNPWLRLILVLRWLLLRLPSDTWRNHLAFRLRLPLFGGTFVVGTAEGIRFQVWDLFELVQRYVFWTGTWEHEEAEFLQRSVKPGDVVVDVGAQLGYFTLTAGRAVGASGRVIAVEPMPVNRERLRRNLDLNGFTNVEVVSDAAGARVGVERFASRSDRHQTSWGGFAASGDTEVQTRPLDDILAGLGVDGIAFLKIDVEGGEPEVLAGASRLLETPSFAGPLLIEINELRLGERGHSGDGVIATLTEQGFRDVTTDVGLDPEHGDRNLVFVR